MTHKGVRNLTQALPISTGGVDRAYLWSPIFGINVTSVILLKVAITLLIGLVKMYNKHYSLRRKSAFGVEKYSDPAVLFLQKYA